MFDVGVSTFVENLAHATAPRNPRYERHAMPRRAYDMLDPDVTIDVVGFNRDLGVEHHAFLRAVVSDPPPGGVFHLHAAEPDRLAWNAVHPAHVQHALGALADVKRNLRRLAARLTVHHGRMPDLFDGVGRRQGLIREVLRRQETGDLTSLAPDRRGEYPGVPMRVDVVRSRVGPRGSVGIGTSPGMPEGVN